MSDPELVAAFRHAVYTAVQEIPHGRVTNYAQIAFLIGEREFPLFVHTCCDTNHTYQPSALARSAPVSKASPPPIPTPASTAQTSPGTASSTPRASSPTGMYTHASALQPVADK